MCALAVISVYYLMWNRTDLFLVIFNMVNFFSFHFFPHMRLRECVQLWGCNCVWEKVRLEKARHSFTGNYWLGLELRNKISHSNQSHFGLCHIFRSVRLLSFATPSARQTSPQGGETWGWTHTRTSHISNPSSESLRMFFPQDRPIIKGDCECKRLQGLFESLKWLKLWFPLGIYGHNLLPASDVLRLTRSVSQLVSPVDRKVACCWVIYCCIFILFFHFWTSSMCIRKRHHGKRCGRYGGTEEVKMSIVREQSLLSFISHVLLCGNKAKEKNCDVSGNPCAVAYLMSAIKKSVRIRAGYTGRLSLSMPYDVHHAHKIRHHFLQPFTVSIMHWVVFFPAGLCVVTVVYSAPPPTPRWSHSWRAKHWGGRLRVGVRGDGGRVEY